MEDLIGLLDRLTQKGSWRSSPDRLEAAGDVLFAAVPELRKLSRRDVWESGTWTSARLHTDDRSVWFAEGVRGPGSLDAALDAVRGWLEYRRCRFDVIWTVGSASIGPHFDDSDNVSFQLLGAKRWSLAPPETLDREQRRLRYLGEPGLGGLGAGSTDEAGRFDVGSMQALYIPFGWGHWGVSTGDSYSVSLVLESSPVWQVSWPGVRAALRQLPGFWEPIHTGPGSAARRRAQVRDALAAASFEVLVDEVVVADPEGVLSGGGTVTAPTVAVDIDAVSSYVKRAPAMPREELVPIGAGPTGEALEGLLARRNVRKLLKLVVQRARHVEDPRALAIYGVVAEVLSTADDDTLTELCVQPEITSWLAVAENRPDPGGAASEDDLADPLALAMLPELTRADYRVGVRAAKDRGHGVTLRQLELTLFGDMDALHLLVGGGSCDRVSGGKPSPIDPQSIDVMPLPTFGTRTVLTPWPTAWLARTAPPNAVARRAAS